MPSTDTTSGATVTVPEFSIAVTLSSKAKAKLQSLHETIKVLAMFDGDPLPGQGKDRAPMRGVYLGSKEVLVDANNNASFSNLKVKQSDWNRLADKDYYVTINVYSARRTYKNNLLDCGFLERHLSAFAGKSTAVHCWLIEEPDAPINKQN
jgi:hypothetical protein